MAEICAAKRQRSAGIRRKDKEKIIDEQDGIIGTA
jgi:hypothetical protein